MRSCIDCNIHSTGRSYLHRMDTTKYSPVTKMKHIYVHEYVLYIILYIYVYLYPHQGRWDEYFYFDTTKKIYRSVVYHVPVHNFLQIFSIALYIHRDATMYSIVNACTVTYYLVPGTWDRYVSYWYLCNYIMYSYSDIHPSSLHSERELTELLLTAPTI